MGYPPKALRRGFGAEGIATIDASGYGVFLPGTWVAIYVAEPPNLMPPRSARLPLDTKHSRKTTKLLGSVGHTPGENPKIHIFPSGSQMRE